MCGPTISYEDYGLLAVATYFIKNNNNYSYKNRWQYCLLWRWLYKQTLYALFPLVTMCVCLTVLSTRIFTGNNATKHCGVFFAPCGIATWAARKNLLSLMCGNFDRHQIRLGATNCVSLVSSSISLSVNFSRQDSCQTSTWKRRTHARSDEKKKMGRCHASILTVKLPLLVCVTSNNLVLAAFHAVVLVI